MAQKKKSSAAAAGKKRGKAGISWQEQRQNKPSGPIALIALVGAVAILLGYLLENTNLLSLNAQTQDAQGGVCFNEIVSDNVSSLITDTGDAPDWVEITNTADVPVAIGRYSIALKSNINKMFTFPDYTLQPGEKLVIRCAGTGGANREEWSASFKLDASGGDTLVMLNAQGRVVDLVELPELGADAAYCRDADGSWRIAAPTPGADNDRAGAAPDSTDSGKVRLVEDAVEITEVMSANTLYFADENGETHDYVEIHNASNSSVNLEGWYLSDSSDKLKRWAFPSVTLPAGAYLAVHCSAYNRTEDVNHLHTDFKLSSDGESVYLSRPDGRTVSICEAPQLLSGQVYSLVDGKWSLDIGPTPGMENTAEAAAQTQRACFGDRSGDVQINEIMATSDEEQSDWLELYNGSSQAVDLSDYGLSDHPDKPRKWQFPTGTTLQPGEYRVVYLSGSASVTAAAGETADFALSATGGSTVTLSDPEGNVLDAVYLPRQYSGISYGRVSQQAGFFYLDSVTQGAANGGNAYRSRAAQAACSVGGGQFHSGDRFTVELSVPQGSRVYYTLDCSDPDESSTPYTGPIQVSATTILRTRVYRDGCMPSLIDTQSYLYDVDRYYEQGVTYIVSLVSDPDNLYSDEKGIMIMGPNAWPEKPYGKTNQGANFWMDWEREAHVELFKSGSDALISQGCGIKLHGQYSRANDVKAFKVLARSDYGDNRFDYPIFSNRDYDEYQSFLLRTSGQDWDMTFMRDSVLSALARDTSVMYQESEIGVCFLNGEYYSLEYLRERVSKHSICQFEGWEGMEDDIDLIKANDIEKQGSNESFEEILDWIKNNDVSGQAFYDYLDSRIDIQNYLEYMAIEIFVGNGDTLNVKRYRNASADGKWRWVLFDLDWGFFTDTNSIRRWLDPEGMGTGKYTDTTLFIACMKNSILRERFLTYMGEQMATTFTTQNMLSLFQQRYAQIEQLLPEYREKWSIPSGEMSAGMKKLYEYCKTRPTKLIGYFQQTFNFTDAELEKYFGAAIDQIQEYKSKEAAVTDG